MEQIDHIVLFSGGLASFEAGKRVLYKIDNENVKFWFFDTLVEDPDLYRFMDDCMNYLNIDIEIHKDSRNPWQVFRDEKFIGNTRVPLCTRVLKRRVLEKLLKVRYPKKNCILYLGYENHETNRISKSLAKWQKKGFRVDFPLQYKPILSTKQLRMKIESYGLKIPNLYNLCFKHNNCGGACVQAGLKQWSLLYKLFPERYLWNEEQEQLTRKLLNKDVSILRDRRDYKTKPLTLKKLRLRIEKNLHQVNNKYKL